ncbi:MAG: hypothetical protein HN921_15755 [Bacteroidetes bacterium]|jgi:hypothetical protein|nr:hypothetical protein [Bacteroidota bacterium]MBT3934907.1 hypothetical protein [Bacteroidota bacterium]MBT4727114.1 hypothetical protein [Bacteroidota bacterium]MBT7041288.1 hypothetical protein [Bacteroidota bacterium]
MNTKNLFKLLFILGIASVFICCNEEEIPKDEKASLEVFVKKYSVNGPKVGNITVELFLTKNARDIGNIYKTATTPTTEIEDNGALFEDLSAQVYYLQATFSDSGHVYEGIAELNVAENSTNEIDIITTFLGSWQVFVREGNVNGPNVGDAKVEIFLTESDRTNNNPMEVKYTPTTGFETKGVLFESLPYQKYYLRGSYTNATGYWVGIAEGYAEKGKSINKVIVCVL